MPILAKIQNRAVQKTITILQSLKKMDEEKVKMLFVFEGEQFLSILTIGDIQRAIIKGVNMGNSVAAILQTKKKFVSPIESREQVRQKMLSLRAESMPVVDEEEIL